MNTYTPRTDAKAKSSYNPTFSKPDVVDADFARTLERELNAEVEKAITQNDKLIAERDQFKAESERLKTELAQNNSATCAWDRQVAINERDAWREVAELSIASLRDAMGHIFGEHSHWRKGAAAIERFEKLKSKP